MSKKKNKKFKKPSASTQPKIQSSQEITSTGKIATPSKDMDSTDTATKASDPYAINILNEKYLSVHKDVNKLLIVLSALIVLLVITYFIGAKTNILSAVGDWLYRIGNFTI